MFNQPITIVNRIVNPQTHASEYKISHLKGFFSEGKAISVNGVDLVSNKTFTCRILMSEPGYVKPGEYKGIGWTLRNDDYIVKGHINAFDPKEPGESLKIQSVFVKDYGSTTMQHYEING